MDPEPSVKRAEKSVKIDDWLLSQERPQVFLSSSNPDQMFDHATKSRIKALIRKEPQLIARLAELLRTSHSKPSTTHTSLIQLAHEALEAHDERLSGWLREETSTTERDLDRLFDALFPKLSSENQADRKTAEPALAMGLIVFSAKRRNVPPGAILERIADAFDVPAGGGPSDTRPAKAVNALIARARPQQLRQFAAVYRLQEQLVREAQALAEQSSGRVRKLQEQMQALEAQLERSKARLAVVRRGGQKLRVRLAEERRRGISTTSLGAHQLDGFRAHMRNALGERMLPIANTATDALEIEPPATGFAVDYLNDLKKLIEKELKWLDEPSE